MSKSTTITQFDAVTNLAFFLLEKTGDINGTWSGRMTAAEQRALFGRFLGKGLLIIKGLGETVVHRISCCFGLDYDDTPYRWVNLGSQKNLVHV